jgi:hypothetical protein
MSEEAGSRETELATSDVQTPLLHLDISGHSVSVNSEYLLNFLRHHNRLFASQLETQVAEDSLEDMKAKLEKMRDLGEAACEDLLDKREKNVNLREQV